MENTALIPSVLHTAIAFYVFFLKKIQTTKATWNKIAKHKVILYSAAMVVNLSELKLNLPLSIYEHAFLRNMQDCEETTF